MSNSAAWQPISTAPRDEPIFVRSDACVSVARYSELYGGWVPFADGYDACTVHGHRIVIAAPELWMRIPDVDAEQADTTKAGDA